ncbi:MAG: DNA phosphorothioation system sulfurtransferase DndC [Gammaproteobacteria bacterium]|nr:DNA phosphorothioation system sulfurtransferase DndC [Gammaproteobacteria bacterium]MCW8839756.1 DNA phosphorothioation system sulfurtransferase DndC [Gammaproteobacteria bacterium]MCW8959278.1 DNA phosphorothioation system sulfurtransferase DndC [Gammaproteobacteria bacterium]MCW8992431.1 DNA phosphorothioation system sulfurtransferase DndC [Gammaproteobacteria bacterium]
MVNKSYGARKTAFGEKGIDATIEDLVRLTQQIYLEDDIPWVVGYSGGKDSTATLQIIWNAISTLPQEKQHKVVHVISTDTLVENPVVSLWVDKSLKQMDKSIRSSGLPFETHRLTPQVQDRFWVNLIGKGYPAPRPKFRWCTSRLKINPSNNFITNVVQQKGEAILVLGTRKAESSTRHAGMKKREKSTRDYLSKNADPSLDRTWVYAPIADWSNDDVWEFLALYKNPWKYDNDMLLTMYRGATKDNECPLVVDSSTPSCGDSRFGCFVCTMVEKDKSMEAMIQNDDEKKWMQPLVEIRNKWLDIKDRSKRDFRRMNGSLLVYKDRLVHGPYKQEYRENLLYQVLVAQEKLKKDGPKEVKKFELITIEDLEEIRRIWIMEKHEIEDSLPSIYTKAVGKPYPVHRLEENQIFKPEDLRLLDEVCKEQGDEEGLHYQLIRELLHVEQQHRTMARRKGLYDALDKALDRGAFSSSKEAEDFAIEKVKALEGIKDLDEDANSSIVKTSLH